MPHPTVQMSKKKNPIKKVLSKLKNINVSPPEAGPLLPNKPQPKDKTCLKKLKESFKFEVPIPGYVKRKNKVNLVCDPQNSKSGDDEFKSLMSKNEYYEACLLIHDVQQSGKSDGSELYEIVAQRMWTSLSLALDGDPNQTAGLRTVSQCLQWAKELKCSKGPDWSPQGWDDQLESLFDSDIKKHNPKADLGKGLDHYLEELEKNISEVIRRLEQFPEVLTAAYLKRLHADLLHQLTSLLDKKLKYEDHVLLFRWTHKEHRRLCMCLVGSEDFDHMLFGNWFLDSGNKIASTGREAIYKTFVEILQSEIVWNSYPESEVRYYFTDVLEEGTRICKAVEDLGDTLVTRLQSLLWQEILHFVTRYTAFLTEKVKGAASENGICVGIRIVKNCSILRSTMENLDGAPQDMETQGIQSLLGQCESKGIDLVLSNLKPSLKEAFQNYFKKSCNEYENVLRRLKCTFVEENIQNDQTLITLVHHRLVVLFIQSFFKCSKKLSSQNSGEMFSNGSRKLQDFFSDMVSDHCLLSGNPLNFISEILTADDSQSLHPTTFFFVNKHQDLREEHLNAILNIKGNLSSKEREDLLYYVRNREMSRNQHKLCYFDSIQVDNSKLKYFMCCPC